MEEADVREVLVSVDIESSGQSPSVGSLLSIGACLVEAPATELYLELKPIPDRPWSDEAQQVHLLDRDRLVSEGLSPETAMESFAAWLTETCGVDGRPIFVGFNAPFDWMFVADYFWRYLGRNPFGVSALDLKSYYMGREGVTLWAETRRVFVDRQLRLEPDHNHNALDDARGQAAIARVLLGFEKVPGDAVEN
jgi:DNA polymerase III epsilon subunit-like protein